MIKYMWGKPTNWNQQISTNWVQIIPYCGIVHLRYVYVSHSVRRLHFYTRLFTTSHMFLIYGVILLHSFPEKTKKIAFVLLFSFGIIILIGNMLFQFPCTVLYLARCYKPLRVLLDKILQAKRCFFLFFFLIHKNGVLKTLLGGHT